MTNLGLCLFVNCPFEHHVFKIKPREAFLTKHDLLSKILFVVTPAEVSRGLQPKIGPFGYNFLPKGQKYPTTAKPPHP